MNVFNETGTMEDPDSEQIQVKVYLPDGTDVTVDFVSGTEPIYMVRDGLGQYHVDFSVLYSTTETALTFRLTYAENSNIIVRDGIVLLKASSSDYSSILGSIEDKIDDVKTVVDGTDVKVDTAITNVGIVDSSLAEAKGSGFITATDSLRAIRIAIDGYLSNGGTIKDILDSISLDQTAIKGTGFDTAIDSLKAISDRIFTGGIAL